VDLGKFTELGAIIKFVNGFLCEIKAATDVDGFEPALFAPAPSGAGGNVYLPSPLVQTDDCSGLLFDLHDANVSDSSEWNEIGSGFKR